jgi:hypothetical protein
MSTAFHDKLVAAGINPDIVLRSSLKTVLNRFQQQFHPPDSIGYAYGLHHDTDNLHAHVAICPRTAKGHYVGLSMSRTRESGNKNQMTYLMRAFDRENRKWDKLLSNPDKLRKALGMHLESEKMAIAPKISAKHLQVLQKDESLHASRLRNSYQGEKKARNFIRSLSSVFPKNTGGTQTRMTNPDPKRIEGGFLESRRRCPTHYVSRRALALGKSL